MAKYLRLLLLILVLGTLRPAGAAEMAPAPANITTIAGDSMNLTVVDYVNDHYVVVQVDPPVHNWFCGQFTHLPTDQAVTIGLSMEGMDTPGNQADVQKWIGLRPVLTYADPTKYASYEWFQKDANGRWVSGDPFKQGAAKFAGTGTVPEQGAIPKEVAEQFLSEDGTYWQPWREIDAAEAVAGLNIFRMTQTFAYPTATVAMRVPFTYTYLQLFIERLQVAKLPGVFVDEAGVTPAGQKIQVIRIEPPLEKKEQPRAERTTILVYAREHGTEQDSSHVLAGMLKWLFVDAKEGKDARERNIWLFIPILDVSNAVASLTGTGDFFIDMAPLKSEAVTDALYVLRWLDAGQRIDAAINLHNVECNEGQNISCPFVNINRKESVYAFNKKMFDAARNAGFSSGDPHGWGALGIMGLRMAGWCYRFFDTQDLAFEVNTRYPQSRLTLQQTEHLGCLLAMQTVGFLQSPEFDPTRTQVTGYLEQRPALLKAWWEKTGRKPEKRYYYDIFTGR